MDVLARGFTLAEAPALGADGELYVADTLSGGVHRIDAGRVRTEVLPGRRGIGGMALARDGELVVTGRTVQCGEREVIGEQPGVAGFNDLGVLPDGTLLIGALTFHPFRGEHPTPGVLFYGSERLDAPRILWPNGIGCSPDGATVYVADYADGTIHVGPARGPWEPWLQTPRGSADGLAVDVEGGVWVALGVGAGVARFTPDGVLDSLLELPSAFVSSVCFAGTDLIVTTATDVRRAPVGVEGLALARAEA